MPVVLVAGVASLLEMAPQAHVLAECLSFLLVASEVGKRVRHFDDVAGPAVLLLVTGVADLDLVPARDEAVHAEPVARMRQINFEPLDENVATRAVILVVAGAARLERALAVRVVKHVDHDEVRPVVTGFLHPIISVQVARRALLRRFDPVVARQTHEHVDKA